MYPGHTELWSKACNLFCAFAEFILCPPKCCFLPQLQVTISMGFQIQSKQPVVVMAGCTSQPQCSCPVLHKGPSVRLQNIQGLIHKSYGLQASNGFVLTAGRGCEGSKMQVLFRKEAEQLCLHMVSARAPMETQA